MEQSNARSGPVCVAMLVACHRKLGGMQNEDTNPPLQFNHHEKAERRQGKMACAQTHNFKTALYESLPLGANKQTNKQKRTTRVQHRSANHDMGLAPSLADGAANAQWATWSAIVGNLEVADSPQKQKSPSSPRNLGCKKDRGDTRSSSACKVLCTRLLHLHRNASRASRASARGGQIR